MVFKIEKDTKLEDVENLYVQLYQCLKRDEKVDVLLPKSLDNNYFGIVPAIFQLVVTWSRSAKAGNLRLPIDDPNNTDWELLYENELVFPIVSYVWNDFDIYNETGQIKLRSQLIGKGESLFNKMQKVEHLKGNKLLLTEFDHLPEDKGILPCFEKNGKFIVNDFSLGKNLKSGLDGVLSYSKELQHNFDQISSETVKIVFELMKNTWEWGREDANRVALDPSLRGVLIRFFKKRRSTLLDDFRNHVGLTDYFTRPILKENSQGEIYFLEISVFDSGIGYVDRYRSMLPEAEEWNPVRVVKECLIKHNTSATGLGKDDKGRGLDQILSTLDGKGFLRIKTGNVCVYRNMVSHRYQQIERGNTEQINLFDWRLNSETDFYSHQRAEGSVVTIVYPLSIR